MQSLQQFNTESIQNTKTGKSQSISRIWNLRFGQFQNDKKDPLIPYSWISILDTRTGIYFLLPLFILREKTIK